MTLQELEVAYLGRNVSTKKIGDRFRYLGKFGMSMLYQFSFDCCSYNISTDVCIEDGAIAGLIPEKLAVTNEWGETPEDCDELTEDEVGIMKQYLDSVMITEAELAAAAQKATVMDMDFQLFLDDEDEEEE